MSRIRKAPTKREMIETLRRGEITLPPLSFRMLELGADTGNRARPDAVIQACWRGKRARFVVACKPLSTPRAFESGISELKAYAREGDCLPLLFLPFLSEGQLKRLEKERINGLDLCGNGVVCSSEGFAVFRSGQPNCFTSSVPIKNIYRKNSSMAARVFLASPIYETVTEVWREINQRNVLIGLDTARNMSLSTVSKALKVLQEDLIVRRDDAIRLLQPDKLLQKLRENYIPPAITRRVSIKVAGSQDQVLELLQQAFNVRKLPLVATGMASVGRYAAMQRGDALSVYCPRLGMLLKELPREENARFPNLELLETADERVYFDAREEQGIWWASPVQVYLELMTGDKRDQQTAEQVESHIMNNVAMVVL